MTLNNKQDWLQKNIVVCLGALICCGLWGSAFPSIKIGYELFNIAASDMATQMLFAGVRFTLAGILTILLGSIIAKERLAPKKTSWGMIFKLCMVQTVVQYVFFYIGLANTTGVKASIIEAMNVFIAIFMATLFFGEKLTGLKAAGCTIGFVGVVLINVTKDGIDANLSLFGEGFILLSTVAYALSQILIKKYSAHENPVTLSGYQFMIGGMVMAVVGFAMGGRFTVLTPSGMVMLLYLACISAVAYSLWGILLKHNPVSKVAIYGFTNPVFGVFLSAMFLDGESSQAFGIKGIVSLVLVCLGIYLTNMVKKEK